VIRIVGPVRDEGQDPVEFGVGSKRPSGGSLGAACEALECRLVVLLAGTRACHRAEYRLHPRNLDCRLRLLVMIRTSSGDAQGTEDSNLTPCPVFGVHHNAIIVLRCCQLSGRWEEFWEARSVG